MGFLVYAYNTLNRYGVNFVLIQPWKQLRLAHRPAQEMPMKHILLWTPTFWGYNVPQSNLGDAVFQKLGCKVRRCSLTTDRHLYNNSSAVFFLFDGSKPPAMRKPRGQRWVFFTMESPQQFTRERFSMWKRLFNWTMTYRWNADLMVPYAELLQNKTSVPDRRDYAAIMKAKPRTAAWMVSNCGAPSGRDQYVKEMIRHGINVDVYGSCGKLKCPMSKNTYCMGFINKTYKFYLSFENSLCTDYITEKLYKVLPYDVIPIVRGGANYTKIIPHKWYINTADFPTVKALARYLQYLDGNPEKYAKFFEKRAQYRKPRKGVLGKSVWCDFCEKLHNSKEPRKSYGDMGSWWDKTKDCHKPRDV